MRGLGFVICGAIATGLHIGAFYLASPDGGNEEGGAQGADQVSLTAAAPQMQAMVQRWQEVPQVVETAPDTVAQPSAEVPKVTAPQVQQTPVALPSLPDVARIEPMEDAAVETAPAVAPPPPPQPEPPKPVAKKPVPKPAPKAPAAAPAPKKQASGAGTAQRKSTGGTTAAQSQSKAQIASLRAQWGARIFNKVRRNFRAPRSGGGTAKVALTVSRDGRLMGVSLVRSSGNASVDQAAVKAVQRARRFAKAPKGLTKAQYQFSVSLTVSK